MTVRLHDPADLRTTVQGYLDGTPQAISLDMTVSNASLLVSLHSGKARALRALDARIARARTLASKILLGYLRADVESL